MVHVERQVLFAEREDLVTAQQVPVGPMSDLIDHLPQRLARVVGRGALPQQPDQLLARGPGLRPGRQVYQDRELLGEAQALLGLRSLTERESWRSGEGAEVEAGHISRAVSLAWNR